MRQPFLACLAFVALSGAVAAQEPQPAQPTRVFLGARLGAYLPSDDDALSPFSFNGAPDAELLVGLRLTPNFSAELAVGYAETSTDTLRGSDPTLGGVSMEFKRSDVPITASARAGLDVDRVTFYGLAGVGYHLTKLTVHAAAENYGEASLSEERNVFGWHVGAGLSVAVTHRLSLGAELRRTFVDAKYDDLLGPENLDWPTTRLKLDGLRLGATIGYRL